jgi:hypothetical protein
MIEDLKAIENESFAKRRRFGFYHYLGAVLDCFALLKRRNEAKISTNRIAKLFRIRTQKRTHPIRVIIDATSASDSKTKSRWSRSIRCAWHERTRWTDIQEFWRENHGAVGAAARWSALQRRRRNRQVGPDTQDLVSEVPLIVAVPLVEPGQLFAKGGRVFRRPDVTEGNPQK